jgi:hypothetical protein
MASFDDDARFLAETFRYSGDALRAKSAGNSDATTHARNHSYQEGLLLSPLVTPLLADRLKLVGQRLKISEESIDAFIYASADIQAECHAGSTSSCVVRISSSLVDLLNPDEFEFVIGHELGHFLLNHGVIRMEQKSESLEYAIQNRAQEISADRIGLVACQSLETAVRALMKTVSGLSSEHLRFDVGAFLSQLKNAPEAMHFESRTASHPSILVRCRALLWFSMSGMVDGGDAAHSQEKLKMLEGRIMNDMDKFVDGPAKKLIEDGKNNLAIWIAASCVVQDEIFDKDRQQKIAEMFGDGTLEKLKNFLGDLSSSTAQDVVYDRMKSAREELEGLIPVDLESTVNEIKRKVEMQLG